MLDRLRKRVRAFLLGAIESRAQLGATALTAGGGISGAKALRVRAGGASKWRLGAMHGRCQMGGGRDGLDAQDDRAHLAGGGVGRSRWSLRRQSAPVAISRVSRPLD